MTTTTGKTGIQLPAFNSAEFAELLTYVQLTEPASIQLCRIC
jgi:hypothetical protein